MTKKICVGLGTCFIVGTWRAVVSSIFENQYFISDVFLVESSMTALL